MAPRTGTLAEGGRELGKAVRDYILRRTKDKVLTEMPPKLFRDAELELTPEQWATSNVDARADLYALTRFEGEILHNLGSIPESIAAFERALALRGHSVIVAEKADGYLNPATELLEGGQP